MQKFYFIFIAIFLLFWTIIKDADAIPSFAREMKQPCSACHTQWPQLNPFGRYFKAEGYSTGETQEISEGLTLSKALQLSARLNLRIMDKRISKTQTENLTDSDTQFNMRSFHEGAVFFAGKLTDKFSYFAEIEAEDESGVSPPDEVPGFNVRFASGVAAYRLHKVLQITGGLGSPYFVDAHNTVHHHKNVRKQWAVQDKGFLPDTAQFISLSGSVANLSYIASLHGNDSGDAFLEGKDPEDVAFRVVYDIAGVSAGGFFDLVNEYDSASKKSKDQMRRYGLDIQADIEDFHLNSVLAFKDEDKTNANTMAVSAELQYVFKNNKTPVFSPILIVDHYTKSDGSESFTDLATYFTYFFRENIKAQLGWEGDVKVPSKYNHKENRFVLVVDMGF